MRIAALYDIHGNLPALEAVLAEVQTARVDRILIGGDVLPGPMPTECLDRLSALNTPVDYIIGNGDRETVAARRGSMSSIIPASFRDAMQWNADQLRDADVQQIDRWPLTRRMTVSGVGDVVFCHATPRNDTDIFTRATADEKLRPIFDPLEADLVVCGHTHMQFDRRIGRTRVINAGSVGMPFQEPGAYWLLIGSAIELRRTPYDSDAAAAQVRATRYPQAEAFASGSILTAPAEPLMVENFSKAELS